MRAFAICASFILAYCTIYAEAKVFPGFFVPEELQTILQLVYSRLPPTKIGSDKRFGVGFRLGKNADAQILVELGPQSDTQPLGEASNNLSKRESKKLKYIADDKTGGKETIVSKTANKKEVLSKTTVSKKAEDEIAVSKSADNKKAVSNTAEDKSGNLQRHNTVKNLQKRPEPFINVLIKWLTRFNQSREHNFNKNNT